MDNYFRVSHIYDFLVGLGWAILVKNYVYIYKNIYFFEARLSELTIILFRN